MVADAHGELTIKIAANADTDAEELAGPTSQLHSEFPRLDVDAVGRASDGESPGASEAAGPLVVGGLIVRFAPRQDLLQSIVRDVRSGLWHRHARTVKPTLDGDSLELTGATSAQQDRLVDLWVKRHAGAG
jgi:hypothetical protein